jgi:hypothetical protein
LGDEKMYSGNPSLQSYNEVLLKMQLLLLGKSNPLTCLHDAFVSIACLKDKNELSCAPVSTFPDFTYEHINVTRAHQIEAPTVVLGQRAKIGFPQRKYP